MIVGGGSGREGVGGSATAEGVLLWEAPKNLLVVVRRASFASSRSRKICWAKSCSEVRVRFPPPTLARGMAEFSFVESLAGRSGMLSDNNFRAAGAEAVGLVSPSILNQSTKTH